MYTFEETYKSLVIAGAGIVKDLKAIHKAEFENVESVFEKGVSMYDALKYLVNVAADLTTEDEFNYDTAQIYYADTISVFAYNEEIGEKYFDLLWRWVAGEETAKAELDALSKTIPDSEHYWVRRNV